jgi:hypothetical protein
MQSVTARLSEDMSVLGPIQQKIAVAAAAKNTPFVFNKWCRQVTYHGTWKAICTRRGGAYKPRGKDNATHHWNDDLAECLIRNLDGSLRFLVGSLLPGIRDDYIAKMEECTKKFPISLKEAGMGVTKNIADSLENLSYRIERYQADLLREAASRFDEIITKNREVHLKVSPKIGMHMGSGYANAARQKGKKKTP